MLVERWNKIKTGNWVENSHKHTLCELPLHSETWSEKPLKDQIWRKCVAKRVWAEGSLGLPFLFPCAEVKTFFPGEALELTCVVFLIMGDVQNIVTAFIEWTEKWGEIPVNNDILSPDQGLPMEIHPGFLGVFVLTVESETARCLRCYSQANKWASHHYMFIHTHTRSQSASS